MNTKATILYVEDDVTLSFVTRDNLELHGYHIDYCENGVEALKLFNTQNYDLCILDVMLPKMDGYELAERIRKKNQDIPIIFLTAKSTREDKIHGLKLGADDFMTKPFSIEELVLRIEVFLKRSKTRPNHIRESGECSFGHFSFDYDNHKLKSPERTLEVTHREAEVLKMFCEGRDKIIKRDDILNHIWGTDHYFASRSLDVFISRLRKYLKSDPSVVIENIHNVGYRLKTE